MQSYITWARWWLHNRFTIRISSPSHQPSLFWSWPLLLCLSLSLDLRFGRDVPSFKRKGGGGAESQLRLLQVRRTLTLGTNKGPEAFYVYLDLRKIYFLYKSPYMCSNLPSIQTVVILHMYIG